MKNNILAELLPETNQKVFFSNITYKVPQALNNKTTNIAFDKISTALMLTGIANPEVFREHVSSSYEILDQLIFDDHHQFKLADIQLLKKLAKIHPEAVILTTEKDAMRLLEWKSELEDLPIYYIPIKVDFLEQDKVFRNEIHQHLTTFKKDNKA